MVPYQCRKYCCWKISNIYFKDVEGKNKSKYNPHIDNGDYVVVTNIDKIKFTGKKLKIKNITDTGHPGGIKEISPSLLSKKNKSHEILKLAVKKMLPSGPLAKKQLTKLKIWQSNSSSRSAKTKSP